MSRLEQLVEIGTRWPQFDADGLLWGYTGSSALSLLLESCQEKGGGSRLVTLGRESRDIDVVSLRPGSSFFTDAPSEWFWLSKDGRLKEWAEGGSEEDVLVDAVTGYHFDTIVPQEDDFIPVEVDGDTLYVLSPEMLVYLKCFGFRPLTTKHLLDCLKLIDVVDVDIDVVLDVARQTPYSVVLNGVSCSDVRDRIRDGSLPEYLCFRISESLANECYFFQLSDVHPDLLQPLVSTLNNPVTDAQADTILYVLKSEWELNPTTFSCLMLACHNIPHPSKKFLATLVRKTFQLVQYEKEPFSTANRLFFYFGNYLYPLHDIYLQNRGLALHLLEGVRCGRQAGLDALRLARTLMSNDTSCFKVY